MNEVQVTISVGQKPASGLKLVVTLVLAASISALFLSSAYQITKPIIDANNARALKAAVFKVVPGSTQMQPLALLEGQLVVLGEEEETDAEVIYAAYDDAGTFLGYAIENAGSGFQDIIRILYGYDPARKRVIGMEVLESRETPGLGDKIWKDESFVSDFYDLAIEPEIIVVKGASSGNNEVDAITGATISSKAVVRIINEANARWLEFLPAPGEEPPMKQLPELSPPTLPGVEGLP